MYQHCVSGECLPTPQPDGTQCGGDGGACCNGDCCHPGTICGEAGCVPGCWIGEDRVPDGTPESPNSCLVCKSSESDASWSLLPDKAPCGEAKDRICCNGTCCGPDECCSPAGLCEECCAAPSGSRKQGTGTCSLGCTIGGVDYDDGEVNPNDGHFSCEVCDAAHPTEWSPRFHPDCPPACTIDDVVYAYGTLNPQNECKHCDGGVNATAWSPADGAVCGEVRDRVCCGGTCCGADECCGPAGVCQVGSCAPVCTIDGVDYPDGTVNPANPCEYCEAVNHPTAWMYKTHGRCGPALNQFCCFGVCCDPGVCCSLGRGSCDPEDPCDGCTIEGAFYYDGEPNPANSCDYCKASRDATSWSYMGDGGMCEDDLYRHCCNGACCADGERCNLDDFVCEPDPNRTVA
jgi:hypothetical protein